MTTKPCPKCGAAVSAGPFVASGIEVKELKDWIRKYECPGCGHLPSWNIGAATAEGFERVAQVSAKQLEGRPDLRAVLAVGAAGAAAALDTVGLSGGGDVRRVAHHLRLGETGVRVKP